MRVGRRTKFLLIFSNNRGRSEIYILFILKSVNCQPLNMTLDLYHHQQQFIVQKLLIFDVRQMPNGGKKIDIFPKTKKIYSIQFNYAAHIRTTTTRKRCGNGIWRESEISQDQIWQEEGEESNWANHNLIHSGSWDSMSFLVTRNLYIYIKGNDEWRRLRRMRQPKEDEIDWIFFFLISVCLFEHIYNLYTFQFQESNSSHSVEHFFLF